MDVIIPDMVRYEVTRDISKPGAREFLDWLRQNEPHRHVRIASTEVYDEFLIVLKDMPDARTRGRGEESASEVFWRWVDADSIGMLLFEDSDVKAAWIKGCPQPAAVMQKNRFTTDLPPNVLIVSTSSYLDRLERHHMIPEGEAHRIIDHLSAYRGPAIANRNEQLVDESIAENPQDIPFANRPM